MFGVFKTSQIKVKKLSNPHIKYKSTHFHNQQLSCTVVDLAHLQSGAITRSPWNLEVFIYDLHILVSNLKGVIHESGVLLQIRKSKTGGKDWKKRMLNPYDQNGLISLGEIPQSRIAETKYKHLSSYLLIYISNLLFWKAFIDFILISNVSTVVICLFAYVHWILKIF